MTGRRRTKATNQLAERCGQVYCLCSGGRHIACATGKRIDDGKRETLEAFSKPKGANE